MIILMEKVIFIMFGVIIFVCIVYSFFDRLAIVLEMLNINILKLVGL